MDNKAVGIVGAGFAGLALTASLVRQAVDNHHTDLSITLLKCQKTPGFSPGMNGSLEKTQSLVSSEAKGHA